MLPDFGCERPLLLQGPAGPFFKRLAWEMGEAGMTVHKVNFHSGDVLFFPGPRAVAYRGSREQWPSWIRQHLVSKGIDAIFLFGDCRAHHRAAIEVAEELGVDVWVFEEGYLRPDYITLERGGVNGFSSMPRDPDYYRSAVRGWPLPDRPRPVDASFAASAWYSMLNALAYTLVRRPFRQYEHHRPLNAWKHTAWWVRGAARKLWFSVRERHELEDIAGRPFFFVPLQVHCDFQIVHSDYDDIIDFIHEVVASFAEHAPDDHLLVLKHHPMDRPFRDYGELFAELSEKHGLGRRLRYVHDLHLPTLLRCARGTVTINSTVGLSSIHHETPVKVMGTAVYDMPGLTFQGDLADFFRDPGEVDRPLYKVFRRYLRTVNQANGSFYRRVPGLRTGTGVRWFPGPPAASRRRALSAVESPGE